MGGGGGGMQRSYASVSGVPALQQQPLGGGPQRSYASVSVLQSRQQAAGGAAGGQEKKVVIAGVRTWLKVLPDGTPSIVQLDRAQLGLQYGVQLRDFRVLDPVLGATYPACLLCREGALIVNLDHIKVIITAQFALVNHSESDKARPFTDELKRRLQHYSTKAPSGLGAEHHQQPSKDVPPTAAAKAGGGGEAGDNDDLVRFSMLVKPAALGSRIGSSASIAGLAAPSAAPQVAEASPAYSGPSALLGQGPIAHVASAILSILPHVRPGNGGQSQQLRRQSQPFATPSLTLGTGGSGAGEGHHVSELVASMPFELRALEVVLEQTVSLLDGQTTELERATRMALDELTLRVDPRNLERMRHLKGRMAALSNKVDTVRGVLEKLLDDDRAMAAMNLTSREEQQQQAQAAAREERAEWTSQLHVPSPVYPASSVSLLTPQELHQLAMTRGGSPPALERMSSQLGGGGGAHHDGGEPDSEVAVVEMLLEAYFMQLGHTWQRLQSLKSYIDSTEDLINLELDQQRNNLISVDLMVTFGSFLLTAMSVIAGLFGMNVTNHMEGDYSAFLGICIGSAAAAGSLWLLFVYCSIRYGLMNGLSMTWR